MRRKAILTEVNELDPLLGCAALIPTYKLLFDRQVFAHRAVGFSFRDILLPFGTGQVAMRCLAEKRAKTVAKKVGKAALVAGAVATATVIAQEVRRRRSKSS